MKHLILSAALILSPLAPALAQMDQVRDDISAPLVQMTPVLKANADMLELTEAQRADLKNWLATMPAKRKAIEAEARAARAALRTAVLDSAPMAEQTALAEAVGAAETKLVMARVNCVNHWRETLNADQFAQLVALSKAQ